MSIFSCLFPRGTGSTRLLNTTNPTVQPPKTEETGSVSKDGKPKRKLPNYIRTGHPCQTTTSPQSATNPVADAIKLRNKYRMVEQENPAMADRYLEQIKDLLQGPRAQINATEKDEHGYTPLMLAAIYDDPEVARLLLQHLAQNGSASAKSTGDGKTALMYAAIFGDPEVLRLLLQHPAHRTSASEKSTCDGKTALMYAVENRHIQVLKALLEHPEFQNTAGLQDKDGKTALMHAIRLCKPKTVLKLLKWPAVLYSLDIKNKDGDTALKLVMDLCRTSNGTEKEGNEISLRMLTEAHANRTRL